MGKCSECKTENSCHRHGLIGSILVARSLYHLDSSWSLGPRGIVVLKTPLHLVD
jgi:hypothetical protein